ncbi:8463_t:CDS:2 [Scutellospora calospora]|uniref:8463_t:CDS:1 n=1 Tax=Scutellospora calospora TaxID=85575 RepID=A0ACA9K6X9_9GLOM|nr:8463_t:CDS:2 [Scutellospora calospora]
MNSPIVTLNIGELFKYILEFLRNNKLLKRTLTDRALLEELLQEAKFYCIEGLINEIKSKLCSTERIEPIQYYVCLHEYDPIQNRKDRYMNSSCRHSHIELVGDYVPFMEVSNSIPIGPVFDSPVLYKKIKKEVIKCFR